MSLKYNAIYCQGWTRVINNTGQNNSLFSAIFTSILALKKFLRIQKRNQKVLFSSFDVQCVDMSTVFVFVTEWSKSQRFPKNTK